MSAHLHIIVLAAGASTRLGRPKQLEPIAGRPALHRVVSNALATGHGVSVVLGAQAAQITPLLQHSSAGVLINRQWREGLAASIRCGVTALSPACAAVLLLLGDQVAVNVHDLQRLIAAWNGQETLLAASVYQAQLGVPAIFPRWCFSELLQLHGDQGAKLIINRYASRVNQVPMAHAGIDLDTNEQVTAAQAHLQSSPEE